MNASPNESKTRIVIVDDHQMFREQLAHLIDRENDMVICGQADSVATGLETIRRLAPDIVIVDITLKGASGLELLKDLRAHEINVPALVLSMHDESLYAERALRAGARGYITKNEASAKVMVAIRQVLQGELYLVAQHMSRIVDKLVTDKKAGRAIDRLTDRELEVFELIGRGQTTREIGTRLNVGSTTVDTYRARIKEKLDLENAARLYSEASRWVQERQ